MKSFFILINFVALALGSTAFALGDFDCVFFPNEEAQMIFKDCARPSYSKKMEFEKSFLKKIKFNDKGLAGGAVGNSCYWVNKAGKFLKTLCYDNGADYFNEGLARYIDEKGRFGFMNEKLEVVIPAKYKFAEPFTDGQAGICNDCHETKNDPKSEYTVMKGGTWMYIDKTGKVIHTCPKGQDNCQG